MLTVEFQEYMGVKIHKTSIFDPNVNKIVVMLPKMNQDWNQLSL